MKVPWMCPKMNMIPQARMSLLLGGEIKVNESANRIDHLWGICVCQSIISATESEGLYRSTGKQHLPQ